MNWFITSLLSAAFFSASNAVTKIFQPKLSFGIGMIIFSIGVLTSSVVYSLITKAPLTLTKISQQTMSFAFGAGFIWAFAQLFFLMTLSKNAPLSVAVPIIVGGIGIGGILTGVLFFGEHMTGMRVVGAVIVLAGSIILARS